MRDDVFQSRIVVASAGGWVKKANGREEGCVSGAGLGVVTAAVAAENMRPGWMDPFHGSCRILRRFVVPVGWVVVEEDVLEALGGT